MLKPRILVLTSTYPRWKDDIEPGFVHELAKRLAKNYELHVLSPHTANAKRNEVMDGVFVHRFRYGFSRWQKLAYEGGMLANVRANPWLLLLVPFFFCSQLKSAVCIMRKYKIDLVHAHWVVPQGLVAVFVRLFFRRKTFVVTSHGADVYAIKGPLLGRLKALVYQVADSVTVVSHAMKADLYPLVKQEKLVVAPMGVDLVDTFVLNTPLERRRNIVFVGRLVEKKGVSVLISAFAMLKDLYGDLSLTLVGTGPEMPVLRQQVMDLDIADRVTFLGGVPNQSIPSILNQHAIAVVPSIISTNGDQEGLGLVSIEAMGCGCAVIASDLMAIRDVIDDSKTGLMFEPSNPVSLKQALTRLLDDDKFRCELAFRGNQAVRGLFDWSIAANNYKQLFKQLLTRR